MKKFVSILIILSVFFFQQNIYAQSEDNTISRKEKRLLSKAIVAHDSGKNVEAIKLFNNLIAANPNISDSYQHLAFIYADQKNWELAKNNMEKYASMKSQVSAKPLLYLANYCKKLKDLDCEEENLKKYLTHEKAKVDTGILIKRIEGIEAKRQIISHSTPINLIKLSEAINEPDGIQYLGMMTMDGKELIFTRRVNGQEDFYKSYRDSIWHQASPIQTLNTPFNEGAHSFNADGSIFIYTRCNLPNAYRSCDLYISTKNSAGNYTTPRSIERINTTSWEAQPSLSADGNTLYFSSSRKNGEGKRDIYYMERVNGKWSDVKNIGNVINTDGDEETPFIHPDGRTLYFTSSGHPGLGGKDIFMTRKQYDGSWSKPENLGKYINSAEDEGALSIDSKGEFAYFSKSETIDGKISSYIYKFKIPKKFKPSPVSYIKFLVKDKETKKPIQAVVNLITKDSTERITISKNGTIAIFEANQSYAFHIEKDGYLFYSGKIKETSTDKLFPQEYVINLEKVDRIVTESAPIILQNVTFASNSSDLSHTSYNELNKLVELMIVNPTAKIVIHGHTDNIGKPDENLKLSQERADAVKEYLISRGVLENRIISEGYGEKIPIATNATEEGRAKNRRTEFKLIK